MKLIALLFPILLAGCVATPVKRNFPEVPVEQGQQAQPAYQSLHETHSQESPYAQQQSSYS